MEKNKLADILQKHSISSLPSNSQTYNHLKLEFNPFPKSGTTNINSPADYLSSLSLLDSALEKQLLEYLVSILFSKTDNPHDKFLGATILGDYGSGKTQLLMYIKYLLGLFALEKEHHTNPYVIYIDNPGVKLTELIGNIISEIGEENFNKYLWNKIIFALEQNYKQSLSQKYPHNTLFASESDPWSITYKINYKNFINAWKKSVNSPKALKELEDYLKTCILEILHEITNDNVVAQYFYNILISELGINNAWETIIKGNAKQLSSKEANIIKCIFELLYDEGFTHVFVLVDEFEDVTKGRLTKSEIDNYLYSLRTLIDRERNWTTIFAMTFEAFEKLTDMSPPLSDRISSRKILINTLTRQDTKRLVINYLNMARDKVDYIDTTPFAEKAIDLIAEKCNGNPRLILSRCFKILENAKNKGESFINEEFVTENIDLY